MKKINSRWLALIEILLIIISAVCLIGFGLNGQTKVSGNYPEDIKSISLKCTSSVVTYPFFNYNNATGSNTTINIIFADGKLDTISMINELYYPDETSISGSYSHNHAAMNKSFADDGLPADSFSARYTKSDDKMIMSLYAVNSELNSNSMKYFLATNVSPSYGIKQFEDNYVKQGFNCEQVNR